MESGTGNKNTILSDDP
jgi:hypothetical protein